MIWRTMWAAALVSTAEVCEPSVVDVAAEAAEDDVESFDGGGGGPNGCVAASVLFAESVLLAD